MIPLVFVLFLLFDFLFAFSPLTVGRIIPTHPQSILEARKNKRRKTSNKKKTKSFSIDTFMNDNNKNSMETGIETALLLLDKRRQLEWKKEMKSSFPFVPEFIVDSCVDSVATAFEKVAPKTLKKALQPGGLEKVRPGMESTIVNSLNKQPVVANFPLPSSEKNNILKSLVRTSLDFALQDAKEILADPSDRLRALEEKRLKVTKYMTKSQLLTYHIRYKTRQTILISSVAMLLTYLLYGELRTTALYKTTLTCSVAIVSSLQNFVKKVVPMTNATRKVKRIPKRI